MSRVPSAPSPRVRGEGWGETGCGGGEGKSWGVALLVLLLVSCATSGGSPLERGARRAQSPGASGSELAADGFYQWLYRGEAAVAAARFAEAVKRAPRDPWAHLGSAWMARRALLDDLEVAELLALVEATPDHPLARVALRRLADLAELAPPLARAVEASLGPMLTAGQLRGAVAYRARVTLATAVEARGDLEASARIRTENGTVTAWTLVGPCGAHHALDMDRAFPPELGALRCQALPGVPDVGARILPVPLGATTLEGEPPLGEIYYLVADVRVARGGRYLVAAGSTAALQIFLDGEPLLERRPFEAFPPLAQMTSWSLTARTYRLTVKLGRGALPASVIVSLAREDGAPSDAIATAAREECTFSLPFRPLRLPATIGTARELQREIEPEVGPVLAHLVAARDYLDGDRESAKELLQEAAALLPRSGPVLAALGDSQRDDPTLTDRVAQARAETSYSEALAIDPQDGDTLLRLAELKRAGGRLDDAQALLANLPDQQAAQPRALLLRMRVAWDRGFTEGAERLATEARRRGGHCQAMGTLYDLARRQDAVARGNELAEALAFCSGGRERLAQHRRLRGDPAAAAALLRPLVRMAPARIELRLALVQALMGQGETPAAIEELNALARIWPREARLEKQRAELLEQAGDRPAARQAREKALRLDGSDLKLRRALGLENGREVLEEYAEDGAAAIRTWNRSGQHPRTSSVLVLDAAAVLANPDGSTTERIHQVIQVLDQRGVERWGEVGLPSGAQILKLRTIKADGRALEPEMGGEKNTISLAGLEPRDYLEYEYLHATSPRGPSIPGFSADSFYFQIEGAPMFRSSYVVAAPVGTELVADGHNLAEPAQVKVEGDREVLRLVRTDVPALVSEPGDPGSTEYLPFVQVGSGAGREELAYTLGDATLERTRPTVEIRALARSIAGPAGGSRLSGEELVRAAYEKVSQLVEGQGGSWTESASQVLSRGRGSRTVLLMAIYRALGIQVRVALVRPYTSDPAPYRFPRPDLNNYPVLWVRNGTGTYWLDPAVRYAPFGALASEIQGAEALLLPASGEVPLVIRTPGDGRNEDREVILRITPQEGGDAVVEGIERYPGYEGAMAKAMLERLNTQDRRQTIENSLMHSFRGLTLESLAIEGEGRFSEPLVLRWRARVPQFLRTEGTRTVVEAPLYPVQLGARYATLAQRATPLLIGATERVVLRVEMVLPAGFHPAGENREVLTGFGNYRRLEREERGLFIREDQFQLQRARIAPADYPAFARFAKTVDEAQEVPMVMGR